MDPLKVSAQFAAYMWFTQRGENRAQAMASAQRNWGSFLPVAHTGLGKLLIRIGAPAPSCRGVKPLTNHERLKGRPVRQRAG
jgi:hypothetical protein